MAINTGIKATSQFLDILSSVIGQMSDGIWENTRSMERYWKSLSYRVDENRYIILEDRYGETSDPADFFANKIKQIVRIEMNNNPAEGLIWDRGCRKVPHYLDRSYGDPEKPQVTVGDCYKLYDMLKGRRTENRSYAQLKKYNLEVTWAGTTVPLSVWAFSSMDAKKKVKEQVVNQLHIREVH